MANDAFALSPISASGALPSEADYHAISEAFMETSRGRWFLKEYARRNRNADTAMVLDAVSRIESTLAAQKQPAPAVSLDATIAAIRAIVDGARTAAEQALDRLSGDEARAPSRKGVRIILEVAWRLREIGYDGRICDILEAQANSIGANQDALATLQTRDEVMAAFDLIARQVGELAETPPAAAVATPAPVVVTTPIAENVVSLKTAAPSATPLRNAPPADTEAPAPADAVPVANAPAPPAPVAAAPAAAAPAMTAPVMPAPPLPASPAIASEPSVSAPTTAAAAKPAPIVAPAAVAAMAPVAPAIAVAAPPPAAPAAREAVAPVAVKSAGAAADGPLAEAPMPAAASLGDALLARGMVAPPVTKTDPLTPIRRMSQAEKIAFFS